MEKRFCQVLKRRFCPTVATICLLMRFLGSLGYPRVSRPAACAPLLTTTTCTPLLSSLASSRTISTIWDRHSLFPPWVSTLVPNLTTMVFGVFMFIVVI